MWSLDKKEVDHSFWPVILTENRVDSRFVLSQWETLLQSNAASHWLGTNLESALWEFYFRIIYQFFNAHLVSM